MTLARKLVPGEYYHVYNRGLGKQTIFKDSADWLRFLYYILYMQSGSELPKTSRVMNKDAISDGFAVSFDLQERIVTERGVELTAFCLMPNHFHLLVHQRSESGISAYTQRVLTAYARYFNTRYDATGHVFQDRYRTVHVKDDVQLMHLSAYIHRNPRELKAWRGKEEHYPYSSLQDYVDKNRWGGLLSTDIIAGRFENTPNSNYRDFVRTSGAKEKNEYY